MHARLTHVCSSRDCLKHAGEWRPSGSQLCCSDFLLLQHHKHIPRKHNVGYLAHSNFSQQLASCTDANNLSMCPRTAVHCLLSARRG